jgi:hypothetical protein
MFVPPFQLHFSFFFYLLNLITVFPTVKVGKVCLLSFWNSEFLLRRLPCLARFHDFWRLWMEGCPQCFRLGSAKEFLSIKAALGIRKRSSGKALRPREGRVLGF